MNKIIKIQHRVNTIKQLKEVPEEIGIELDIRSSKDGLYLHHDPFVEGETFEGFLENYRNRLIILNTKEEGLEEEILRLMEKYEVKNYFFLDLSLPYLVKLSKSGVTDIAIRFSEYEPIELASKFRNKIKWVWVDCFSILPLDQESYDLLKRDFKICLVSPELQGHEIGLIEEFQTKLKNMPIDAVCTKHPELW